MSQHVFQVVLKETNKAKTQINKERAILKRKNPVALKPFKVQKQTKVYETVGNTKQLKTAKIIINSKLRYVYLDVLADLYPNTGIYFLIKLQVFYYLTIILYDILFHIVLLSRMWSMKVDCKIKIRINV